MRKCLSSRFVGVLVAGPWAAATVALAQPVVLQVPPLYEGSSILVTAMSADGQYVVGVGESPDGDRAVRWRVDSASSENLGCIEGCTTSAALAVSADGSVIVGVSMTPAGNNIAFRWSTHGGMESLGDLTQAANKSPKAVSGDGSIVAGSMSGNSGAFVWSRDEGYRPLDSIQDLHAEVWAISTDGSTIVGRVFGWLDEENGAYATRAAKWDSNGALQLLDAVPLSEVFASTAMAVNADGSHIAGRMVPDSNFIQGNALAARWVDGGDIDAGFLFDSYDYSGPMGVTADGSVYVFFTSINGGATTLWYDSFGFITLANLLNRLNANVGNAVFGITYPCVDMISDDGSRIAGVGYGFSGPNKSWVVKDLRPNVAPPDPCFGDTNGDRVVNFQDINLVLSKWGLEYSPDTGPGDANFDGIVDFQDITQVVATWNYTCFAPSVP